MSKKKKAIRKKFREIVFARDKNTCRVCGDPAVDAHHIIDRNEMPDGGYILDNGISLCSNCHIKAEVFHSSGGTDHEEGFLPEDLQLIIQTKN